MQRESSLCYNVCKQRKLQQSETCLKISGLKFNGKCVVYLNILFSLICMCYDLKVSSIIGYFLRSRQIVNTHDRIRITKYKFKDSNI